MDPARAQPPVSGRWRIGLYRKAAPTVSGPVISITAASTENIRRRPHHDSRAPPMDQMTMAPKTTPITEKSTGMKVTSCHRVKSVITWPGTRRREKSVESSISLATTDPATNTAASLADTVCSDGISNWTRRRGGAICPQSWPGRPLFASRSARLLLSVEQRDRQTVELLVRRLGDYPVDDLHVLVVLEPPGDRLTHLLAVPRQRGREDLDPREYRLRHAPPRPWPTCLISSKAVCPSTSLRVRASRGKPPLPGFPRP